MSQTFDLNSTLVLDNNSFPQNFIKERGKDLPLKLRGSIATKFTLLIVENK